MTGRAGQGVRAPCLLPSLPSHALAIVLSPSWTANSQQGRLDLTVISDCCCSRNSLVRRKFVLLFCMVLVSAFSLLTMTLWVIKSKTKTTLAESKTARVAMSVQNTRNQGPRKHVDRIPFVQFSRQFPRQTDLGPSIQAACHSALHQQTLPLPCCLHTLSQQVNTVLNVHTNLKAY